MDMHKCVTDVLIILCQALGCPVTCPENFQLLLVFQWSFGLMLNMHTVIEAYTYVMACMSANHRICATFSTKRVVCEALIPTDVSSLF